jgi:tetratricopeptide (TPR) repeat protein
VGDLEGAREEAAAAIAAARSAGDVEAECWALLPEVWALVCAGEDALPLARELLAAADRIGSTFSRVYGHVWLGFALGDAGEHAEALEHLERGMALARERRTGLESYGRMLGFRGRVRLELGDVDGALRDGLDGVAYARDRGLQALDPEVTAVRALAAASRLDEAAALLAEADAEIERLGAHAWAPELRLCRADIARARGDATGEAVALREAAAWFDRTGAPRRATAVRGRLGEVGRPGEHPLDVGAHPA